MNYKHPLRHYAATYNRSLSSVKRYAKAGAPLDDAPQMQYFLALQRDTGRAGARAISQPADSTVPAPGSRAFVGTLRQMGQLIDELQKLNSTLTRPGAAPCEIKLSADRFAHSIMDLSDVFLHNFDDEDDDELSAAVVGMEVA